jgi:hypothetical protein
MAGIEVVDINLLESRARDKLRRWVYDSSGSL